MKPDTTTAMRELIREIKDTLPIDATDIDFCVDECKGCSQKLLDYIASELDAWEARLDQGETPNFGDLKQLGASAKKVFRILKKNGHIETHLS